MLDAAALRGRERILTTAEVSERLGRSVSWVEKNLHAWPRRSLAASPNARRGHMMPRTIGDGL